MARSASLQPAGEFATGKEEVSLRQPARGSAVSALFAVAPRDLKDLAAARLAKLPVFISSKNLYRLAAGAPRLSFGKASGSFSVAIVSPFSAPAAALLFAIAQPSWRRWNCTFLSERPRAGKGPSN